MKKHIRIILAALLALSLALGDVAALAVGPTATFCPSTRDGRHTFKWTVVQAATCTTEGAKVYKCTSCGYTSRDSGIPIDSTAHKWGAWKVTKAATCSKKGEEVRKCSLCGKTQPRSIATKAHSWGDWHVTKAATCKEAGVQRHSCKNCGISQSQAIKINPNAHSWGDWKVQKPSTCKEKGVEARACQLCGKKQTRALPLADHQWGEWETVEPTGEDEQPFEQRTCQVCGETEKRAVSSAPSLLRANSKGKKPDKNKKVGAPKIEIFVLDDLNSLNGWLGDTVKVRCLVKNVSDADELVSVRNIKTHFYNGFYTDRDKIGDEITPSLLDVSWNFFKPGESKEMIVSVYISPEDVNYGKVYRNITADARYMYKDGNTSSDYHPYEDPDNLYNADKTFTFDLKHPGSMSISLKAEDTSGMTGELNQIIPVKVKVKNTGEMDLGIRREYIAYQDASATNDSGSVVNKPDNWKDIKAGQETEATLFLKVSKKDIDKGEIRRIFHVEAVAAIPDAGHTFISGTLLEGSVIGTDKKATGDAEIVISLKSPTTDHPAEPEKTDAMDFTLTAEDTSGMRGALNDMLPVQLTLQNTGSVPLASDVDHIYRGSGADGAEVNEKYEYTYPAAGIQPQETIDIKYVIKVGQEDIDAGFIQRTVAHTCKDVSSGKKATRQITITIALKSAPSDPASPAAEPGLHPDFTLTAEDTSGMSGALSDVISVKITASNTGDARLKKTGYDVWREEEKTNPAYPDILDSPSGMLEGFDPTETKDFILSVHVLQSDVDAGEIRRCVELRCKAQHQLADGTWDYADEPEISRTVTFTLPLKASSPAAETGLHPNFMLLTEDTTGKTGALNDVIPVKLIATNTGDCPLQFAGYDDRRGDETAEYVWDDAFETVTGAIADAFAPTESKEFNFLVHVTQEDVDAGAIRRHFDMLCLAQYQQSDGTSADASAPDDAVHQAVAFTLPLKSAPSDPASPPAASEHHPDFTLTAEDTTGMSGALNDEIPVQIKAVNTGDTRLLPYGLGSMRSDYDAGIYAKEDQCYFTSDYSTGFDPTEQKEMTLGVRVTQEDVDAGEIFRTFYQYCIVEYQQADGSWVKSDDPNDLLRRTVSFTLPLKSAPSDPTPPTVDPEPAPEEQPALKLTAEDTSGMSGALSDVIPVKITMENVGQTVLRACEIKSFIVSIDDFAPDTVPAYTPDPMGFMPEQTDTFTLNVIVTPDDIAAGKIERNVRVTCASVDFSPENYLQDKPGAYVMQNVIFSIALKADPGHPDPTPEEVFVPLRLSMSPNYTYQPVYPLDGSGNTQVFSFQATVLNAGSVPIDFKYLSLHRTPSDSAGEKAYVASPAVYLEPLQSTTFPVSVVLHKADILPGTATEKTDGDMNIHFDAWGAEVGTEKIIAQSNTCGFFYTVAGETPEPDPDPAPEKNAVVLLLQAVQLSPVKAEYDDGEVITIDWMLTNQGDGTGENWTASRADTFDSVQHVFDYGPDMLMPYGATCAYGTTTVTVEKSRAVGGVFEVDLVGACDDAVIVKNYTSNVVPFSFPLKKDTPIYKWTPPEVPPETPADGPAHCEYTVLAQGEGYEEIQVDYCRVHAPIGREAAELVAKARTRAEKAEAWHKAQELWKAALRNEYAAAIAALPEEARSAAAKEQMAYFAWLDTHEAAVLARHPDDPARAAQNVCELLADRCTALCAAAGGQNAPDAEHAESRTAAAAGVCVHETETTETGVKHTHIDCALHRRTEDAVKALTGGKGSALQNWTQAQMRWLVEMDSLTNEAYLAADKAGRAAVSADRIAFGAWLEAKNALLTAQYPADAAAQMMTDIIHERTTMLCGE